MTQMRASTFDWLQWKNLESMDSEGFGFRDLGSGEAGCRVGSGYGDLGFGDPVNRPPLSSH